MNVTIISKDEKSAEIEVEGEGHTLLNLVKQALLDLNEVERATYKVNPKHSGRNTEPILYVEVSNGDPLEAISKATDSIEEEAEEFSEKFIDIVA